MEFNTLEIINKINWKKLLRIGIEGCIHCGSYFMKESLLCPYCENLLFVEAAAKTLHQGERRHLKTLSLLVWQEDQNRILNKLVLALKGEKQSRAWAYYARIVATRMKVVGIPSEKLIVTYCPNYKENSDHAYLFACHLAKNLNTEVYKTLKMPLRVHAKSLNRNERLRLKENRFERDEVFFEKFTDLSRKTVLFVDDVITTGSTLIAASEKMKDFKQIIGVSLAFRR